MELKAETVGNILERERLLYLATTNKRNIDNSVVCFAYDKELHIYFGSYSDTLKCRNLEGNPYVAVAVGTLQIHGIARKIPWENEEYKVKREIYDNRFPQYKEVFNKTSNELYEIKPLVIWNYNPSLGEMNRDELVFSTEYYQSIEPYQFHEYKDR